MHTFNNGRIRIFWSRLVNMTLEPRLRLRDNLAIEDAPAVKVEHEYARRNTELK